MSSCCLERTPLLRCLGWDDPAPRRDWGDRLAEVHSHGLAPLAWSCLRQNPHQRARVPLGVQRALQASYLGNALRNQALFAELQRVLQVFRTHGLPTVALKGLHLAGCVYESAGHRVMGDFDLLARKEDLAQIERILLELGYGPGNRPSIEQQTQNHYHLMPFTRASRFPFTLEIHWALEGDEVPFDIDVEGLWRRARPAMALGSLELMTLSPEDLLLHLCVHASYHHQYRLGLRSLCDIHQVTSRSWSPLDWNAFETRARAWGVEKSACLTLGLASEILGTEVPSATLRSLDPEGACGSVRRDVRDLVVASPKLSREFARLWGTERLMCRAATLWRSLFPPSRTLEAAYPSSARWLRYPRRWLDLLRRYGKTSRRLIFGDSAAWKSVGVENRRGALRLWLGAR